MPPMDEAALMDAAFKTWPMTRSQPRHVIARQVHNGAGFSYNRRLDIVVFDTWPSGGMQLHGIEIKCSKSDLRRELQDTSKFADFSAYLDLFSIAAPAGVVELDLLPPKWGLYCPTSEGALKARRKPLMLHDRGKNGPIDRAIAAAFVRALVDRSLSGEIAKAEYERGYANGSKAEAAERDRAARELSSQKEAVRAFELASGVAIHSWDAGRIGEAVKMVLDGGIQRRLTYGSTIRELGQRMLQLADELDRLSENFPAAR